MDVRFCEGRNHRREAHVRAAGSDRAQQCALLPSALQENLFLLAKDLHGRRQLRNGLVVDDKLRSKSSIREIACQSLQTLGNNRPQWNSGLVSCVLFPTPLAKTSCDSGMEKALT